MTAFIQDNLGPIVGLLAILLVVGARRCAAVAWRRAAEAERRLDALTRGDDGRSLQSVIEARLGRVEEVADSVDRLAGRTRTLEVSGRKAFQRIGLVRFNPFEDTGSNQSFALALLDADDDGVDRQQSARAGWDTDLCQGGRGRATGGHLVGRGGSGAQPGARRPGRSGRARRPGRSRGRRTLTARS